MNNFTNNIIYQFNWFKESPDSCSRRNNNLAEFFGCKSCYKKTTRLPSFFDTRFINLRFKNASTFWDKKTVERLFLFRAVLVSNRWEILIKNVAKKQA